MTDRFGWAIIGPGKIAHRFADALRRMPNTRLVAVHGRNAGRAAEFAASWRTDGAVVEVADSIETLLNNRRIEAIYIATPHAFHAEAIRRCLEAGKPVLCEKPLVPSHALALPLVELARRRRVFLMEAVWTRFLPIYAVIAEWLQSPAIGPIRSIQSSFCFNIAVDPASRSHDPAQAGGALLDIGVYNLSMTSWVLQAALGRCPILQSLHASGVIGPSGVDHRVSATLEFADGVTSQFVCGFDGAAGNGLHIFGEHGVIDIPCRFWEATDATLRVAGDQALNVNRPHRITGFEGEIEEAMAAIRRGDLESSRITHEDSLLTLRWADQIRALIGLRYPFE